MSKLSALPRKSLFRQIDVVANKPVKVVANITAPVEKVANMVANTSDMVANKIHHVSRHGKYADADKRREYMRKYMAARRAGK